MKQGIQIAIDGGAATGKTRTAAGVADALAYMHLSTGLLYRALALEARHRDWDINDEHAVACKLVHGLLALHKEEGQLKFLVRGQAIDPLDLQQAVVSEWASLLAVQPAVRAWLLPLQQAFAAQGGVVVDGRDVGTVVLVQAELKVFLCAPLALRAKRRYEQFSAKERAKTSVRAIGAALDARDQRDSSRELSPLRPAKDALHLDTGSCTPEEQIAQVVAWAKERGA